MLLLMLLLLLVLLVKLFLFPKLVSMHVVVQISIDFLVFGGDDEAVQLVNLPTSFGVAVLYHDLATIIKTSTTTPTLSSRHFHNNHLHFHLKNLPYCSSANHVYTATIYFRAREFGVRSKSEVEFLYYLFYLLLSTSTFEVT